MLKVTILVLLVHFANSGFFDHTDVDDPLALLWGSIKDFQLPQKNLICRVPVGGGQVQLGQCTHKTLCTLSGGQSNNKVDSCGKFLSCCTKPICAKRTNSKVSYFTSENVNNYNECDYIVETLSDEVCQIRLDFENFQLAPSSRIDVLNGQSTKCLNDYMTISPKNYKIPDFCGYNQGQHAYVHLNSERELKLHIHLVNRTTSQDPEILKVPSPSWRIKVTQLECPSSQNLLTKHKFSSSGSDFPLLAPEGATQYFTAPSGRFRSFGFNGVEGEYISDLAYSIAFRASPDTNCVWFTTNYINLKHQSIGNDTVRSYCEDYLLVPDFQEISGLIARFGSRLCSAAKDIQQVFFMDVPAPHVIYFHSEKVFPVDDPVKAFDIHYELRECNFN